MVKQGNPIDHWLTRTWA